MDSVKVAQLASDLRRCYPVMGELRPHLDEAEFLAQVKRQMETQDYRLVFAEDDGEVVAVAGYRIIEMLAWGKAMYVDDLVTASSRRSEGHGGQLFDWLVAEAVRLGRGQLHLDSGVQRFGAHRFYLHKGMDITSHHFALELNGLHTSP